MKWTFGATTPSWIAEPVVTLREEEIEFVPIRAQGAGGQNVNKVSNAIHLRFDVRASSLPEAVKARLKPTTNLADLKDCDLVVEAIVEDLDLKKKLFAELGKLCKKETIFASNTSSFPIGEMADASGRPERFVGLHFFNPVQLMKLVEVIQGKKTSPDVVAAARAFGEACGKAPILAKDTPGFVVNRLLVPLLHEAILMVERGDATFKDVDTGMELGCGHPMGPIKLLDYVGLDTTLSILEGWHQRYPNEPSFKPSELLKKMVKEGKLGRKSGRGFYEWDGDKVKG